MSGPQKFVVSMAAMGLMEGLCITATHASNPLLSLLCVVGWGVLLPLVTWLIASFTPTEEWEPPFFTLISLGALSWIGQALWEAGSPGWAMVFYCFAAIWTTTISLVCSGALD